MNIDRFLQTIGQFADILSVGILAVGVMFALNIAMKFASRLIKQIEEELNAEEKAKNEVESIHRKLKNEDLVLEEEKPKRGRMLIGDDGELLEIVEDENGQYQ